MIDTSEVNALAVRFGTGVVTVEAAVSALLGEAGQEIVDFAYPLCPVSNLHHKHTRDTISWGYDGPFAVEAGPTTWYAKLIENGTARVPPRKFMGPALDHVEEPTAAKIAALGASLL